MVTVFGYLTDNIFMSLRTLNQHNDVFRNFFGQFEPGERQDISTWR